MSGVSFRSGSRQQRMPQPTRPIYRAQAYLKGFPPPSTVRPAPVSPIPVKPTYPKLPISKGLTDTRLGRNLVVRIKEGDLVDGTVSSVADFGVFVQLEDRHFGLVHISQVSHVKVDNLADLFRPGDKVKAVVAETPSNPRKLVLSTKKLETTPGQVLDDPEAVFDAAEATIESHRLRPEQLVSPFRATLA